MTVGEELACTAILLGAVALLSWPPAFIFNAEWLFVIAGVSTFMATLVAAFAWAERFSWTRSEIERILRGRR